MTRLTASQALALYGEGDLHELGRRAREETVRRHSGPVRTYIVDRNINYTNVCAAVCRFCNFSRPNGHDEAYVLSYGQLAAKIEELLKLGGYQILLQGGLHPALPFEWILDMLSRLKRDYAQVHIHGFSPPEIVHFARQSNKTFAAVIGELAEAGLDTIPGGGAEILVDRIRVQISPGKCGADEWLEVMKQAHRQGMRTTATMMFGHIETAADRIEHLVRLRRLQDETGGFTAFICWPFQPTGTKLETDGRTRKGMIRLAAVQDYLRTLAISRLFLDNFANLQASWVTQGPAVGQVSLEFGANDFGSLMLEENVVASAGTRYTLTEEQLRDLIRQAGYIPARRNCVYEMIEDTARPGHSVAP